MGDDDTAVPTRSTIADHPSTNSSNADAEASVKYAKQAAKLSHTAQDADGLNSEGAAIRADWVTPQDPVILTAGGDRLPGVPLKEAVKLNDLLAGISDQTEAEGAIVNGHAHMEEADRIGGSTSGSSSIDSSRPGRGEKKKTAPMQRSGEGSLRRAMPPSRTNPLFPPLPLYGPSSFSRSVQCYFFRTTSFFLSLSFLGVIVLGAIFTSIPKATKYLFYKATFRNVHKKRPFYEEEERRRKMRKEQDAAWKKKSKRRKSTTKTDDTELDAAEEFEPTEGGKDQLIINVGYYARRVGLDVESFKVQTEDGFLIDLWHVYDPREYSPMTAEQRTYRGPEAFNNAGPSRPLMHRDSGQKKRYPVLMMHGLLQSSGAYCCTDDASLAFYLCKSGYDVWLGNNRCGKTPQHTLLSYSDPRMWAWNIRQMGVMDLPALISRVLSETDFLKLGLICHSQGTTQTFVALAKDQRPDLGSKISIFCALAPAVYAGGLLGKFYLKILKLISPAFFRICFGIHSFIPIMMTATMLPGKLFGMFGYLVFSFLFDWSDSRWDKGLRDRCFLFAPTYVSAEAMRWWLGREGFAKQRCILSSREEGDAEEAEDGMEAYYKKSGKEAEMQLAGQGHRSSDVRRKHDAKPKGSTAWYDSRAPPMAIWVAGADDLVDGRRLLRRFEHGREPEVNLVHQKIIPEYEHLDVLWAVDSIDQVGREVKECIWKTCEEREKCRIPTGCEEVTAWEKPNKEVSSEKEQEKQGDI